MGSCCDGWDIARVLRLFPLLILRETRALRARALPAGLLTIAGTARGRVQGTQAAAAQQLNSPQSTGCKSAALRPGGTCGFERAGVPSRSTPASSHAMSLGVHPGHGHPCGHRCALDRRSALAHDMPYDTPHGDSQHRLPLTPTCTNQCACNIPCLSCSFRPEPSRRVV